MTPKIKRAADDTLITLSELDDNICKVFNKTPSKMQFSDEYLLMLDIASIAFRYGKWSNAAFEHIMARFEVIVENKEWLEKFKKYTIHFMNDEYVYYSDEE